MDNIADRTPYWGDLLMSRRKPEHLQSLSHYVGTLLAENVMNTRSDIAWLTGPTIGVGSVLQDFPLPDAAAKRLSILTYKPVNILQSTSFYYLLKKFGWSIQPRSVSQILNKVLRTSKCFCPYCLRERPYFIIPWQFSILPGCHRHNCTLAECCPHCQQTLPLSELYVGTLCPKCGKDLSTAETAQMLPEYQQITLDIFLDLEYLLTAQGYENDALVSEYIGQELSTIRKSQHKTQYQLEESLGFQHASIMVIEANRIGRPFIRYWDYCSALQVHLRDLFNLALTNKRRQREQWTADELLAEVNRVYPLLSASNEHVTQQMIADEVGATLATLKGHKKVRARLAEIAAYDPWTADELLAEVNRVYPLLSASNERVTQQMIADEVGATLDILKGHKKVRARLAEIITEQRSVAQ